MLALGALREDTGVVADVTYALRVYVVGRLVVPFRWQLDGAIGIGLSLDAVRWIGRTVGSARSGGQGIVSIGAAFHSAVAATEPITILVRLVTAFSKSVLGVVVDLGDGGLRRGEGTRAACSR